VKFQGSDPLFRWGVDAMLIAVAGYLLGQHALAAVLVLVGAAMVGVAFLLWLWRRRVAHPALTIRCQRHGFTTATYLGGRRRCVRCLHDATH